MGASVSSGSGPSRPDVEVDVAVVGASLAGCAAASLLGRAGLTVALLDKHAGIDSHKALCGNHIQASATPVIERLGLAEPIEAAGGVRNGLDIWTPWGVIESPLPPERRPHGYSLRRFKLDPVVRRTAVETPGVEYLPGHKAVGLLAGADGAVGGIELEDRGRRRLRVGARLVVGADGRNSSIAELAGGRDWRFANRRFCYASHFSGVELPPGSRGRLWLNGKDVAIAAVQDDGLTALAAFGDKSRIGPFRADRERALLDFVGGLPDPPGLANARHAGKFVAYTDYELIMRDPTPQPTVALIGDAALSSDPAMGIGCGWAFESAEWLSDIVAPALSGDRPLRPALRRYRRTHRRRLAPHHLAVAFDARGYGPTPLHRMLFTAGARDPQTAELLARFGDRSARPQDVLMPKTLLRAARASM